MTDHQVKLLFKLVDGKKVTIKTAAAKAGLSEPTAHSYLRDRKLPRERKKVRNYRTRPDAFAQVWEEAEGFLRDNLRLCLQPSTSSVPPRLNSVKHRV